MPQIFPKWTNTAARALPPILLLLIGFIVFVFWYWCSPWHLNVGYKPEQPIDFSHKLHAEDLDIDCFYCHHNAEKSAIAGVPSTQTCMNCHEQQANKDSHKLKNLMKSWQGGGIEGGPIPWVRVHKVGGYAYFDHSAHVAVGVSCISCHGDVSSMEVVRQEKPLSMGWCLECHRNPAPNLRPVKEVSNMKYHQTERFKKMAEQKAKTLNPPVEDCSGCHR